MKKENSDDKTDDKTLPSKYNGPKFDAHVHLGSKKGIPNLIKFREEFNIKKSVGIVWDDNSEEYETNYPGKFVLAKYFRSKHMFDASQDPKLLTDEIEEIYQQGFPIIKFWFGPRVRDYIKEYYKIEPKEIRLSDPFFKAIFAKMEELGLILLIHVGDPDLWYEKVYQPVSRYGTKEDHLKDFEEILLNFPKLKVLQAHFGSQPEDLENLSRWFDTYPNYYIDSSSARWMARELGRHPEKAREFFVRHSDRILFGTDIVQDRNKPISEYYQTRYYTFQALLETSLRDLPLPFPDPENDNKTKINGLDLPLDVLKKIYWENAKKFFQLA
ncbi:MAG: amidohydrolase family protein [Promethearchaeota archaeon]|jgi:predicted TIM-barrel fold metal-dependent hydrolase